MLKRIIVAIMFIICLSGAMAANKGFAINDWVFYWNSSDHTAYGFNISCNNILVDSGDACNPGGAGGGDIEGVLTPDTYLYGGCTTGTCSIFFNDSNLPVGSGADGNASSICDGDTTYLSGNGNCNDLSGIYQATGSYLTSESDTLAISLMNGNQSLWLYDSNESTRVKLLISYKDNQTNLNCPANQYQYGSLPNGTPECRADITGGAGGLNYWQTGSGQLEINSSATGGISKLKANLMQSSCSNITGATSDLCTLVDTNTNTNCSAVGSCPNIAYDSEINKTYVDTRDQAQDACSEITGCVQNAYNTQGNLTTALSGIYQAAGSYATDGAVTGNISYHEANYKHGNTTAEIRNQFSAGSNISITDGKIAVVVSGLKAYFDTLYQAIGNYVSKNSANEVTIAGENITSGTIADARIASTIARDSEINKTYVDTQDSAQDECSEIGGCVQNAYNTEGNLTALLNNNYLQNNTPARLSGINALNTNITNISCLVGNNGGAICFGG